MRQRRWWAMGPPEKTYLGGVSTMQSRKSHAKRGAESAVTWRAPATKGACAPTTPHPQAPAASVPHPPPPCPPSSSSSFLKIKRYISFAPMKWRLMFALWFKWFDFRLFKIISKYFLGLQKLRLYDWMHFTWNLWLLDSGNPCNSEARCGWV